VGCVLLSSKASNTLQATIAWRTVRSYYYPCKCEASAKSGRVLKPFAYNLRQMKTLAALVLLTASASFAQDYGILIRNGRLVDGAWPA